MNKSFQGAPSSRIGAKEQLQGLSTSNASLRQKNAHCLQQTIRCRAAALVEDAPKVSAEYFQTAAKEMPAPQGGKLKEKATAYIEEHRIRAYEADPNQRTTIVTMSNLLQVEFATLGTILSQEAGLMAQRRQQLCTCRLGQGVCLKHSQYYWCMSAMQKLKLLTSKFAGSGRQSRSHTVGSGRDGLC